MQGDAVLSAISMEQEAKDGSRETSCDFHEIQNVDKETYGHLTEHEGLKRVVGLKSVIGLNLASMLGSCLLLPGIANSLTGSSAFFAIIVSGLGVLPACLSKAELSTAMPHSGGAYIYLARAFGPLLGCITGVGLWFDLLFQVIFGLRGSTEYIHVLFGDVSELMLKVIGITLLILVLLLNLSGMKWIKVVTKYYTLLLMVVLMGIALSCFGTKESTNTNFKESFFTTGVIGFFETVGFVHMGYGGLTKICALASEVKNPGVNLPTGMFISLFIMVAWFATVTSVLASIMPDINETNYYPFYTMGKTAVNDVMGKFAATLCVIGMASMGNVSLLAVSRFPFAMARDGLVPLQFEAIWHRTSAPWFSLCFCSVVVGVAIVTLPIKSIIKLASSFKILVFVSCNICVFVFRHYEPEWYKPEFRSPFYPFVQIFGVCFGLFVLSLMGVEGLIAILVIIVMGIVLYMSHGRYYAKFLGTIQIEKFLGLVPLAYLDHKKMENVERQTSLSTQDLGLLRFVIHNPKFLEDWRKWKTEEILFWFAHHDEGRYEKYHNVLADTVPKFLISGEDLRYANDLVLRVLGIDDAGDRERILRDLAELEMVEKPEEMWAHGVADLDSLVHEKDWMEAFQRITEGEEMHQTSPGLKVTLDTMSTTTI